MNKKKSFTLFSIIIIVLIFNVRFNWRLSPISLIKTNFSWNCNSYKTLLLSWLIVIYDISGFTFFKSDILHLKNEIGIRQLNWHNRLRTYFHQFHVFLYLILTVHLSLFSLSYSLFLVETLVLIIYISSMIFLAIICQRANSFFQYCLIFIAPLLLRTIFYLQLN